jgi:hypothetical protein
MKARTLYDTHEDDSLIRYCKMQEKLDECVDAAQSSKPDEACLHLLAGQVDVQLKLEDFLLRSREANHAKIKAWGPIAVPAAVSFIVALMTMIAGLILHSHR